MVTRSKYYQTYKKRNFYKKKKTKNRNSISISSKHDKVKYKYYKLESYLKKFY